MMTKREAVKHFNGVQSDLAKALGLKRAAVCRWDWDKPIPERHELRLRYELLPNMPPDAAA